MNAQFPRKTNRNGIWLVLVALLLAVSLSCVSAAATTEITATKVPPTDTLAPSLTNTDTLVPPTATLTPKPSRTPKPTETLALNSWVFTGLDSVGVFAVAIDPLTPTTVYAGGVYGLFKSTNEGWDWSLLDNGLTRFSSIWSLAIDPVKPTTLYAGTEEGVFKSKNGGDDWELMNSGIPDGFFVNSFAIDPSTPDTIYAGATHYSGGGYNSDGVVLKSTDGGREWREIKSDLKENNSISIVIDPSTPTTVYFGMYGGLYKSTDGGDSWHTIHTGLTNTNILSLAIDPVNPKTLYAGMGGGKNSGLFKSTNGGGSWTSINLGLATSNIIVVEWIAIDPLTTGTVYIGLEEIQGDRGNSLGVYKSTNGGEDWTEFNNGFTVTHQVYAFAIDPVTAATLYLGSSEGIYVMHQTPAS